MYISALIKNRYPFALGAYHYNGGAYPDPTHSSVITIASGSELKRDTPDDPILVDVPGIGSIVISPADKLLDAYKDALLNDDHKPFKHAALIRYAGIDLLCGFDSKHWDVTLSIDAYGTLSVEKVTKGSKHIEIKLPEVSLSH